MQKKNVYEDVEAPLERHEDDRGIIADIFYKSGIDHVAIIRSNAGAVRGNHYHEVSTQHMLITKVNRTTDFLFCIQLPHLQFGVKKNVKYDVGTIYALSKLQTQHINANVFFEYKGYVFII